MCVCLLVDVLCFFVCLIDLLCGFACLFVVLFVRRSLLFACCVSVSDCVVCLFVACHLLLFAFW